MKRMLQLVELKFGSNPSASTLAFEPGSVTIFVGPNNSGKSLLLREIEQTIQGVENQNLSMVKQLKLKSYSQAYYEELLTSRATKAPVDYGPPRMGQVFINRPQVSHSGGRGVYIDLNEIRRAFTPEYAHSKEAILLGQIVQLLTVRLDGLSRFQLTASQPVTDLLGPATNHLLALWQDNVARKRIRDLTMDAFNECFVLDANQLGTLRIRFAKRYPSDSQEEQGWDEYSRNYHQENTLIDEMSDGVKAFTGLTAAVISFDFRVMLIDEPEAFLHPVLAKKLGATLTKLASERDANVFASTHSAEFLMGCIEAGKVNVVRLTYRNRVPTGRSLRADKLREMMSDPLLRTTGVLNGLFHESVVVCENDGDRCIYQEVNQRLLDTGSSGIDNTLFLNAYEKATVQRVIKPLREMGIPAAAVVDLDVIKGKDLNQLLRAAFVPQDVIDSWSVLKSRVLKIFTDKNLDPKINGLADLSESELETVHSLLDSVSQYGVFIVPCGELEDWFSHLKGRPDRPGRTHKSRWVPWIFKLMNDEPELFEITTQDIWSFVRDMKTWMQDPDRKGIPA